MLEMSLSMRHSLQSILKHSPLIAPGDKNLVAVSGGPDSLSLLHAFDALKDELQLGGLYAAHLDHGLRGEESAAEAQFVADFCAERNIPCRVGKVDVKTIQQESGNSKQEAARDARYAFLEEAADEFGANKIATAHTKDDQVETILFNILRGTGLEGLKGIPAQRGRYIRPLLNISRAEIEAYCTEHNLNPRRDPSNQSPENYTRNRIRLELLPALARDYNPNVQEALLRLSQIASRDQDYLQSEAQAMLPHLTNDEDTNQLVLDRHGISVLHPAMQRHIVRAAIERVRGTLAAVTYDHVDSLCEALSSTEEAFGITLPHPALIITLKRDTLTFRVPSRQIAKPNAFSTPLPVPSEITITETGWTIKVSLEVLPAVDCSAVLGSDRIDLSSLIVRNWQVGDRMAILGMNGKSKKVQDILMDAKVPRDQRHTIPIVADAHGILWIAGIAVAERAKTTEKTANPLYLTASPATNAE
jgi:tRNA(Ile)-lysidine synthase